MKKITFLITFLLTVNFTFSQILFEDDFDGSGPGLAGWTLANLDGLTPNTNVSQYTAAWIEEEVTTGNFTASSTSWYTPAGTSNDWMITPSINITGNAVLTWDENAPDAAYPDGYEVRLSTTGNSAPADFTVVLFSTPNATSTGAVFTERSASLSAYNGQSVYIAWRNNSTDQFILNIDNIKVEIPPAYNAAVSVTTEQYEQYTQVPLEQIGTLATAGNILNPGTSPVTNAVLTVNVLDGSMSSVYTASSPGYSLASGAAQAVTFPGFTPTTVDTYTIQYTVTIDETDGNMANNTTSRSVEVTTNTYARDNNVATGSLGIGADEGGYLGQQFDINTIEDILSVTFQIDNTNGDLTGETTIITVWDMLAGVPNSIIAQTDPVTLVATPNQVYTANIAGGPYTLAPGTYLVAIEEPIPTILGTTIEIATTPTIFTPGTTWVSWPSNPTWANNEDFGFLVSYLIRPNFQDENLSVDDSSLFGAVNLYPNPAKNLIKITNPSEMNLIKAEVFDVTGRLIQTYDLTGMGLEKTIDISNFKAASYFVSIQGTNGQVTKQLIVKE